MDVDDAVVDPRMTPVSLNANDVCSWKVLQPENSRSKHGLELSNGPGGPLQHGKLSESDIQVLKSTSVIILPYFCTHLGEPGDH